MSLEATLDHLTKEQLVAVVTMYAKNLIALDGTWFQSIENECGMGVAMHHDVAAWERFTVSEARRLKLFLDLPEHSGLDGLASALALKMTTVANSAEMQKYDGYLIFRMLECRVQTARRRKNMDYHPCKVAGIAEYTGFAREIDARIRCECISCYPDVSDESACCIWKFTLDDATRHDAVADDVVVGKAAVDDMPVDDAATDDMQAEK